MNEPLTLIDKLWSAHEITRREDGAALLWVDRHYVHEGAFHAFTEMQARGGAVAEPALTFAVADHYVPTRGRAIADPEVAALIRDLEANTAANHIKLFGLGDPRQGIVHVVGPEQGLTLPGLLIVCGDSHTSTHGAFGAYAFGIGASEVAHVLMTQTLWQKKPKSMRVIVGDPMHQTPLFSDQMTSVVFSPQWNVPESIIRKEMLPKLVDDPGYLERQDIQVVGTSGELVDAEGVDWSDESSISRLHFRQEPGPKNALGLVKFQFPNSFDVYMHDTPQDSLFNKSKRALSHGCVRLENPVALAEYVLRDQPQWTSEKITTAMNAGREQAVALKEHLPVHIGYFTAWVNPDGSVTYTDDPYNLDPQQKERGL